MAFLVKPLEKWTTSYTERIYSQKKIYLWDNGVRTLLTGAGDEGSRAENAVFMELQRNDISCGYYAESEREVDFVTGSSVNPLPVEVKYLDHFDWQDKHYSGIRLFCNRFPSVKQALVITQNVETTVMANNIVIRTIPLWKFLLDAPAVFSELPAGNQ